MAAASLIAGASIASAASSSTPKAVTLKCQVSLTTVAPSGSQVVDVPPSGGTQYGPAKCTPRLGRGIQSDSFTIPDSGDMVGSYTQYLSTGTVRGKFDLSPLPGAPPSTASFQSQSWSGTVTVTGGTGPYAKATGKKGALSCTSPDSVHLRCTEKVKVTFAR